MINDHDALARLAEACGIAPTYWDIWGNRHDATDAARVRLLRSMNALAPGEDAAAALARFETAKFGRVLPPVAVFFEDAAPYTFAIALGADEARREHRWTLALEDGTLHEAPVLPIALALEAERDVDGRRMQRFRFAWNDRLPVGRHRFSLISPDGTPVAAMPLVIAPSHAHEPARFAAGERLWVIGVQLYSIRSRRNWGIGDFTDLGELVALAARLGADGVGLNPLHALFLDDPGHASPYSPSSRSFVNPLYLDVEALPEYAECEAVRTRVQEEVFQARLAALRRLELVNHPAVAAMKLDVLRMLFRHFRDEHLAQASPHAEAFLAFAADRGAGLDAFAVFSALRAHLREERPAAANWREWPLPLRDHESPAVAEFAAAHRDEVDFHRWLQWHCDRQLAAAAAHARALGLAIGLYLDLAVSVSPDGADAWRESEVYAEGASVGAPPDEFSPNGQDWGLPPWVPMRLAEGAHAPFVETLANNMRHAGALRIDHVMGLARLFWIPHGAKASDGAYVAYPFSELAALLALESARRRCLVIGEDLGTVPDEVRAMLDRIHALSCRVLYFEKRPDGRFKTPAEFPAKAMVSVSTHDLPTLAGFWIGQDLALRDALSLYPTPALREKLVAQRPADRKALVAALETEGLLPPVIATGRVPPMMPALAEAIHAYIARSRARLMLVQIEDALGVAEQPNLPGTTDEHPNWVRKLPVPIEDWEAHEGLTRLAARVARERAQAR